MDKVIMFKINTLMPLDNAKSALARLSGKLKRIANKTIPWLRMKRFDKKVRNNMQH